MAAVILMLGLMARIVSPAEATCLDFIRESPLPMDVYIAGTQEDERLSLSVGNELVYVNGPGVSALKSGETYGVVRPEGLVNDPYTLERIGIYYKRLGTVRIAAEGKNSATALVLIACQPIVKGDILVPHTAKAAVEFEGKLSDRLTPFVEAGLSSHIVVAKNDMREMSSGDICFIAVGSRSGVKVGDHFTIYRIQDPFDPLDLMVTGKQGNASYRRVHDGKHRAMLTEKLEGRSLPPRAVGDIVILEVSEGTAAARIVNSLMEVHLGDLVVRR